MPVGTLKNRASVARRIDPSRRRDGLTWSHHAEVAGLEPDEADAVLAETALYTWPDTWSVEHLRGVLHERGPGALGCLLSRRSPVAQSAHLGINDAGRDPPQPSLGTRQHAGGCDVCRRAACDRRRDGCLVAAGTAAGGARQPGHGDLRAFKALSDRLGRAGGGPLCRGRPAAPDRRRGRQP